MTNSLVQPTKAYFDCEINGVRQPRFGVHQLKVFEDICKTYFTAQLVIETSLNVFEGFLRPAALVSIVFEAPRSDGGSTKIYTEQFRIYSYESRPINSGEEARMLHTIQLIGQEYYNDRHNTVTQNFSNQIGTNAARAIHQQYISVNGGLSIPVPSTGLIAQDRVPHQVINKKPVKAIHDILDRVVFAQYKSCAPVYFRNKPGYVISPLEHILKNASIGEQFEHQPAEAVSLLKTLIGYNQVIHFRPVAPPGESSAAASVNEISGLLKATSFFDFKTGNLQNKAGNLANILKLPFASMIPNFKKSAQQMITQASKGKFGAANMFYVLDELMQARQIDKNGPGGYNASQEAFITALTYAQKYWITVPLQTGVNVTCGQRIRVTYPVNGRNISQVLFVPRLIHDIKIVQLKRNEQGSESRVLVDVNGTTDIYSVLWGR